MKLKKTIQVHVLLLDSSHKTTHQYAIKDSKCFLSVSVLFSFLLAPYIYF